MQEIRIFRFNAQVKAFFNLCTPKWFKAKFRKLGVRTKPQVPVLLGKWSIHWVTGFKSLFEYLQLYQTWAFHPAGYTSAIGPLLFSGGFWFGFGNTCVSRRVPTFWTELSWKWLSEQNDRYFSSYVRVDTFICSSHPRGVSFPQRSGLKRDK